jgi:hypothetical protein
LAKKKKQTVEIFLGKKWTYGLESKCFLARRENLTVEILWVLA